MINEIANFTQQIWTQSRKIKKSQSGWLTGNAVCCSHRGESQDTRSRGGLILSANGAVSWHCFNCGFKTSYTPGRPLSFKYRKFLSWLGADPNDIQRLVFEALRVKEVLAPQHQVEEEEPISFKPRSLPQEAKSFMSLLTFFLLNDLDDLPISFVDAVSYVRQRNIDTTKYDFYWTPEVENKLSHRVIIPFKYKNEIVGYTARATNDAIKPRYHSSHPPDFVFNLDFQTYDKKFVLVCEGSFDAMSIDGVGVLSNDISEQQAELIEALGKEVIVVPDFDKHISKQGKKVWPGKPLVEKAIEYGWNVSFPIWKDTCKDVSQAVEKFGKLFVLKSILDAKESNKLKIELMKKKYE